MVHTQQRHRQGAPCTEDRRCDQSPSYCILRKTRTSP